MYLCPVAAQTFLFAKGAPPLFLSPALCLQVDTLPWYFNTACTCPRRVTDLLTLKRKDNPAVALIARLAMIFADILVVVSVGTYTRATREAATEAAFKYSLGRILLRHGVLYFLILSLLNLVHLACWLTGFFSSFMGTLGEVLASIVISRFVLTLWDYDRSGVTTDMTASSQLNISLHFATAPSCDAGDGSDSDSCHANADAPPPARVQGETSSFCRRLVEFMEPLGAPVGGFLGEGLDEGDGNDSEDVAYVLDVEESWRDALNKSGCADCEV
ncbi:hypothetical protein LXA43DRAFT_1031399 [Ganoderma leucocontextum]|nr:hypothetical protein LXA43DRAFT_1031399 [Ganoderma leucocontextum]